jgi:hypothetical protein
MMKKYISVFFSFISFFIVGQPTQPPGTSLYVRDAAAAYFRYATPSALLQERTNYAA